MEKLKKKNREIDSFYFTSFLAWTFNFLAHVLFAKSNFTNFFALFLLILEHRAL